MKVSLECDQSWIRLIVFPSLFFFSISNFYGFHSYPKSLVITNEETAICVKAGEGNRTPFFKSEFFVSTKDGRHLPVGAHFGNVVAYGPVREQGPLFCIPVSVFVAEKIDSSSWTAPTFKLTPTDQSRFFVRTPLWATHVVMSHQISGSDGAVRGLKHFFFFFFFFLMF